MAINIIDKNLSFNSNHTDRKGKPKAVVMHHAAGNGSVEQIHASHKARRYAGIGYHFYIRKDGSIYRGRPEAWQGGHTLGHNEKIGVCAEGNFEKDKMSLAQKKSVAAVLAYLFDKYGELEVFKHRELDNTACPGKNYPFDEIVKLAKDGVDVDQPVKTTSNKTNNVLTFQKACIADGIKLNYGADGIWGPETSKAATMLVKEGDKGERVKLIQKRLGGLSVDGIFGPKTKDAVKAYQSKKALAVDGIVGLNTWRALLGV